MNPSRRTRLLLAGLAALIVFAADQVSKWYVLDVLDLPDRGTIALLPVFNLTMVWNQGVTFGLLGAGGGAGPFLLAGGALLVVAALLVWLWRSGSPPVAAALGAVAGGALGNVADRLRFGAVVDFLHAHWGGWSWYVFNVADAAIVCGVLALVLEGLLPDRHTGAADRHP